MFVDKRNIYLDFGVYGWSRVIGEDFMDFDE